MGSSYYKAGASRSAIMSFRARNYTLDGAVLAATGIADHEAFVTMVDTEFPIPAPRKEAPAFAEYLGGEARLSAPSTGYAHVALAFEGPTSAPIMNVLKECLDMGGAPAFAAPGIVGVYGGSAPGDAAATLDKMSETLSTVPTMDLIENAKTSAKEKALAGLDGGSKSWADAMTGSIIDSTTALAEAYDSVTADDVTKAYASMLNSKVSLAAVGDISGVPYHATIASRFG